MTANPLLSRSGLPDYAAISAEHVVPAVSQLVEESLTRFSELEHRFGPAWEETLGLLEPLEAAFEFGWDPVGHLLGVRNSPELRAAYEQVLPQVIQWSLRVRQSEPLYRALKGLRTGPSFEQLSSARRRIVEDRLRDAELAGISLTGAARERFNQIEEQLGQLSEDFSNAVLDATKAYGLDLVDPRAAEGWPVTLKQLAAQSFQAAHPEHAPAATADGGPWRITLEFPLYGPFMEHCRDAGLREQVYRAFITRASSPPFDNTPRINQILSLKREQARLLGYANYADVSLSRKMAQTTAAVQRMFEQLLAASWEAGVKDTADLAELKQQSGDPATLALWDVAYYAERLRESRYAYSDEDLRPYFPFERVLAGLYRLLEQLLGIRIEPATEPVSVWDDAVRFYRVFDAESGAELAGFFLDPYSRPQNKRGGAWMAKCLGRRRIGDRVQLPVAHLVCNQAPPVGGQPALMNFREVTTLFHEFGHGLQHMLTVIEEPDAAGINGVEWDAVELPSQFLENWCLHKATLQGLSAHVETGEPLPDELFAKINQARTYRAGSLMLRQLRLGMTDLALYSQFDPEGSQSPFAVDAEIAVRTSVLQPLPEDRFLCAFSHIFAGGYSAGYYSYKWAEILSADAFGAFEEVGLDNTAAVRTLGRKFRDTVLALGGSVHPAEVFRLFRGRDPSVEPLLRQQGLPTAK